MSIDSSIKSFHTSKFVSNEIPVNMPTDFLAVPLTRKTHCQKLGEGPSQLLFTDESQLPISAHTYACHMANESYSGNSELLSAKVGPTKQYHLG